MTSIFYPLLISMLPPPLSPPPPPPDLPPHPPRPPPVRSSPSSSRPVNSFRPPPTAGLSSLSPSSSPHLGHPFCGKTCMCIGHIREGITIFSCRTTLAPARRRPRVLQILLVSRPPRPAPTTSRNPRHYPSHPLSIFSSNLFSSPALLLHPPNHPGSLPPAFPSLPLYHLLSNRAKSN